MKGLIWLAAVIDVAALALCMLEVADPQYATLLQLVGSAVTCLAAGSTLRRVKRDRSDK